MEDEGPVARSWEVRIANSREERERIFRFRFDSYLAEFGRWPSAAGADRHSLREASDEIATLFFVESEKRVVATARLSLGPVPEELRGPLAAGRFGLTSLGEIAVADQIVVARAFRRAGVLEALAVSLLHRGEERGVRFLLSHVAEDVARQLKCLGFRNHASPFLHPELGIRTPLVRPLGAEAANGWLEEEFPESAGEIDPGDFRAGAEPQA